MSTDGFWQQVNKDGPLPGEDTLAAGKGRCWLWTGSFQSRRGYGTTRRTGLSQTRLAHRVSYELPHGPIPAGLEIDHLCRVPACVNPAHLEAVTHAENLQRSPLGRAARTHCPLNHPYDDENTIRRNGRRICRECARLSSRARYQKSKAAPEVRIKAESNGSTPW